MLAKKRGMSDGAVAMAVDRARKAGGQSLKKMAKCVLLSLRFRALRRSCGAVATQCADAARCTGWVCPSGARAASPVCC